MGLSMRLNDFKTIDEVVEIGKIEFNKRSTAPVIDWIPSRQNVYSSQCFKYSNMLYEICSKANDNDIINSEMNPSQFIKAAQDFQLSARMARLETEIILSCFMRLANMGMMIKRYNYENYNKNIKKIYFCESYEVIKKAKQLNGLLRAFSEAVYFDDHTISGEFYGDLYKDKGKIVVRSYKRLCPKDLCKGFDDFHIRRIQTYCFYEKGQMDFDCLGNIIYVDDIQPIISGFYGEYYLDNGECVILDDVLEIDKLINILEVQLQKVLFSYKHMEESERQQLLLNTAYYAFKPILEILNLEWHPTVDDQRRYVDSLSEKPEFTKVSEDRAYTKEEQDEQIRRIVDPRIKL